MQQSANYTGQCLGHYRLIQRLGQGGFAEVYLGEHIHLKTQIAVKVLLTHLTEEAVETFRREAQTIARLRHPYIVQVHDFGIDGNTAYLVMDYAPHGTLRHHHPKGTRLPLATIVTYVKQVAEALQYAHEQRLIHRDVKPENMLLGTQHEVLLSDFGIALTAHSSTSQSTQNVAGTIVYMAPEQIQGHPYPASDQYALGIVVYEWLCGTRPFQGTFTEIAVQHAMKAAPSLRQYLPTIATEVEQVVMIALRKDPQQRFPTVRAFAQALEQAYLRQNASVAVSTLQTRTGSTFILPPPASVGEPPLSSAEYTTLPGLRQAPASLPVATPPSSPYTTSALSATTTTYPPTPLPVSAVSGSLQPQRSVSRRTAMIALGGLVTVTSGGLTWFLLSQRRPASSSTLFGQTSPGASGETTTNSQTTLIPATAAIITYQGHTDDVVGVDWSPDGTSIATVAQDGTAQVWSADTGKHLLSYNSRITPAQSNDNAQAVRWSHDNKQLVIGFSDGTAQRIDAMSGKQILSYGNASTEIHGVAWSPDGHYLALACDDGTVQVYEVASGKMLTRFTRHLNSVATVAWSHDGKFIASGSEDTTVQVWSATTGQALLTFKEHTREVSSIAWSGDDRYIASCSWDNTVQIWDSHSGRTVLSYTKHKGGWLNAVAWSPNGKYIASGGEIGVVTGNVYTGTRGIKDVNMHVWEAQTGNTHTTYQSFPIDGLVWSPDNTRVATACTNKVAQVWIVP